MSPTRDPRSAEPRGEMEAGDDLLTQRIAEHFAPDPMTPARRAAFDATLERRLQRRGAAGHRLALAALPAATAVALAALWLGSASPRSDGEGGTAATLTARAWEAEIFGAESAFDAEPGAADEVLPEDYAAIESVLLGI